VRVVALLSGAWAAACALAPLATFVAGPTPRFRCIVALRAEPAASAASPSPSVALVKVTEESKATTASVLGGLAGLLVGGVWVGAGLFAAGAYLSRKEDSDVAKALKGVASGGLEVVNFGAYLNDKYTVTDRIGSALSDALGEADTGSESRESVSSFARSVTDAVKSADQEIGFKDTIGQIATSASDLACQAVDKVVELNMQYKVTDQIAEKINEAIDGAQTSSTTKSSP